MVKTLHLYPKEALAAMLDSGLDFALQAHDGYTPLICAALSALDTGCMSGMTALLGLSALLSRDVALGFGSTTAEYRCNVLHVTAFGRDKTSSRQHCRAVVELLLAHPDMNTETVNAVDIFGQTPLHMAFHRHAFGDCASAFLSSPMVLRGDADNFGDTPLHRLFRTALILIGQPNHKCMLGHVKKLLWKLLHWKVDRVPIIDVFATNDYGDTALDLAKQLGDGFEDIQRTLDCVMHGRKRGVDRGIGGNQWRSN